MTHHGYLFWTLILFLSQHGSFSKSLTKQEYSVDSESSNPKAEPGSTAIEENSALHDSYRPRHKFKTENGHQARFYRSEFDADSTQEAKIPQCAVMFKNNEPVGILQPYEDSYRFLQISGDPTLVDISPVPVKRKSILDVLYPNRMVDDYDNEVLENTAQFADDRYPSIFAKFKIDSRLDKSLNPDLHLKRSMHKRGSEKLSLRDDQDKSAVSSDKSEENVPAEEELKGILDDMGLIDDYSQNKDEAKREVIEDENLELGTNKISMVKEELKEKRDKREYQNSSIVAISSASSKKTASPINTAVPGKGATFEEKHSEEADSIDLMNSNENAKVQDESEDAEAEVSTETEPEEDRKKRQSEKESKRDIDVINSPDCSTSSLVKEEELSEYEKRVEREIRDKIERLKKEVKKEISELKQTDRKDEGLTEEKVVDTKRKKRQAVNTLLDEESVDINPVLNANENRQSHIRRKRNTVIQEDEAKQDVDEESRDYNTLSTHEENTKTLKRFIGINPVLTLNNSSNYHTRTLKEYNEADLNEEIDESYIRVKREALNEENDTEFENMKMHIRNKRETDEELEDEAYQDDDSGFSENMPYTNAKNTDQLNANENADMESIQLDRVENSPFTSSANGCRCDKNSNDCKCGSPKINSEITLPNFKEDANDSEEPSNLLDKKSVSLRCNCGKNDNHCKCGHLYEDAPSPYKHEYFSDAQPNIIDKKSVDEKDAFGEIQAEPQAMFSRRLRDKKRDAFSSQGKMYLPSELRNPSLNEYENYDTDEIVKREARERKFLTNRPFRNGEYYIDLHPDIYKLTPVGNSREKRDTFELVGFQGANPVRKRLVSIRDKSVGPHSRFRRRVVNEDTNQPRQLIDMSDEDLFGALPQSYAGELTRYKRVKRAKTDK